MKAARLAFCLFWVAFAGGCAGRIQPVPVPGDGSVEGLWLGRVQSLNASLLSFKAIGGIRFRTDGRTDRLRVAWVGIGPNKLRLEVFAVPGAPVLTVAADGSRITIRSKDYGGLIRRDQSDFRFTQFAGVPVTMEDLVDLLSGKVPLIDFTTVEVSIAEKESIVRMFFNKRWPGGSQRVELDRRTGNVIAAARYDAANQTLWRAEFADHRQVGAATIPFRVLLADGNGAEIQVAVERYWENPVVDPEVFSLE